MRKRIFVTAIFGFVLIAFCLNAKGNGTINNKVLCAEGFTESIDTVLITMEGRPFKDLLDDIISKNKGKVIYIDCWGTWCVPCLNEMPNSKTLMQKYKGKDVVFVFLCINSEEPIWRSTISKLELDGQHYFLDKKQSSELRFFYKIQGIPYYILYDKNGVLYESATSRPNKVEGKVNKLMNL